MKKELKKLKNEMLDAYQELKDFKIKNSNNSKDDSFIEFTIRSCEDYQEYDRLYKKVKETINNFDSENNKK